MIFCKYFPIKDGLGDRNKVTVLDFATGTGTFLVEVLQQIFDKLPKGSGKKDLVVKEHVLKNIFGFEYLIAPYTIAHLKLSQFLKDNGYTLAENERLQIFLTNTLDPVNIQQRIPFLPALTEESKQAQKIKDKPILVITGNPPYSGHSKNNGEWISNKIKDYYFVDGKPLGEKNSKWLQDDYVKFIRFAQDKMEKVEEGVVGIITNHRFLTNPTFRGMRQSLMKTFDQIYIIDLHGSNKPKEFAPDGGKDENVFDIEQGVAISFFVKKKGVEKKIAHSDFWGTRLEKYERSLEDNYTSIAWEILSPAKPHYLFVSQNIKLRNKYDKGIPLNEIFIKNSLAIVTGKDDLFIDFDDKALIRKMKLAFPNDKIEAAKIKPIAYRVFDTRYIYYDNKFLKRPRIEIMHNLFFGNIALNSAKYGRQLGSYNYFVTKNITSKDLTSSIDSVNTFPLYIITSDSSKEINFSAALKKIISSYQTELSNEKILGYIYSILYSPTYRSKYAEFLKIDFPRIPFTEDKKLFKELSELGNDLIKVHLLETEIRNSAGNFMGKGNNIVEEISFKVENKIGKLFINKTQYFDHISNEVFEFNIGGYQVLHKYLSERKGMKLHLELERLEDVIKALDFTIMQMSKIDELTNNWI